MTCGRCSQEKYTGHSPIAPHATITSTPCVGYEPLYACQNCGRDVERHDVAAPHPFLASQGACEAVVLPPNWPEEDAPPFEGGGGSGGGGGASGEW